MTDPDGPTRNPPHEARPPMPRWVKVFGLAIVLLVLVLLAAQLLGIEHGPGLHGAAGMIPWFPGQGLRS
jgi:hypothetical protein